MCSSVCWVSQGSSSNEIEVPPESALLKEAYKTSGMTAADLVAATGLSRASVHIAMNGIRYRDGEAKLKIPPDSTVVKLASVLHVHPDAVRAAGRERAAGLLEEANAAESSPRYKPSSDLEAQAAAYGRAGLSRQVLSIFSTEELREEIERRDRAEHDELDACLLYTSDAADE